jgi:acetyl coenzyme A synthetase (ADP forming)-like protein
MSIASLFEPSTIAVVGASRERTKIGNIILRNLMSTFSGKVVPVNPSTDNVEGLASYRSLLDTPTPVDLAVIAVQRAAVLPVVDDACRAGVKSAIIITSGFKELDAEGALLEREIKTTASKNGLRVLGPNTLGLITPRFNATFSFSDVKIGNLALVTQSGGIGVYMLNWAHRTRTGLSCFVSLGNECDVNETEVYQYLAEDVHTKAIFSYNEGVADGRMFLQTTADVALKKPIVFLKGGIGKSGAEAVKTHTGSLAGSAELFKAATRTVGGIYIESLEEFLDLAKLVLSAEPTKPSVLVVTNSGGHGVLVTDEIERQGLHLFGFPQSLLTQLRQVLPVQSSPKNPLDLSGDADASRYSRVLELVQDLDCTKIVVVQALPTISCSELAKLLLKYKGKSVIGVVMGLDEDAAVRTLESGGIPAYRFPEDAVRSLKHFADRLLPAKKVQVPSPPDNAARLVSGKASLNDAETFRLLEAYGLKTAKWGTVSNRQEAVETANNIGYPVVMKISTDLPTHKTELGGVRVNVEQDDVAVVFDELSKISPRVLVQEQLFGAEVFLGGTEDPVFGKAVLVGLGGIYVEVFRSVSYGLCPIQEVEAQQMVKSSRVLDLLTARNRNYSVASVVDAIIKVSKLMIDLNIKQLDVNPLIVTHSGSYAVDSRVVLK